MLQLRNTNQLQDHQASCVLQESASVKSSNQRLIRFQSYSLAILPIFLPDITKTLLIFPSRLTPTHTPLRKLYLQHSVLSLLSKVKRSQKKSFCLFKITEQNHHHCYGEIQVISHNRPKEEVSSSPSRET